MRIIRTLQKYKFVKIWLVTIFFLMGTSYLTILPRIRRQEKLIRYLDNPSSPCVWQQEIRILKRAGTVTGLQLATFQTPSSASNWCSGQSPGKKHTNSWMTFNLNSMQKHSNTVLQSILSNASSLLQVTVSAWFKNMRSILQVPIDIATIMFNQSTIFIYIPQICSTFPTFCN